MRWDYIKCAVLGHKWEENDKRTVQGVVYCYDCTRCGAHDATVPWHAGLPTPTRPAPPMPTLNPAAPDLRTAYQVVAQCVEDGVMRGDVSTNKARMALRQIKEALPPEMGGWRAQAEQHERDDWHEREIDRLEKRIAALEADREL